MAITSQTGGLAQLVERVLSMHEVVSSILTFSNFFAVHRRAIRSVSIDLRSCGAQFLSYTSCSLAIPCPSPLAPPEVQAPRPPTQCRNISRPCPPPRPVAVPPPWFASPSPTEFPSLAIYLSQQTGYTPSFIGSLAEVRYLAGGGVGGALSPLR